MNFNLKIIVTCMNGIKLSKEPNVPHCPQATMFLIPVLLFGLTILRTWLSMIGPSVNLCHCGALDPLFLFLPFLFGVRESANKIFPSYFPQKNPNHPFKYWRRCYVCLRSNPQDLVYLYQVIFLYMLYSSLWCSFFF